MEQQSSPPADADVNGQPLPFEHVAPNAYHWTDKAFDLLESGALTVTLRTDGGVHVAQAAGECPRCADDVAFSQVLDAVTGEDYGTLGDSVAPGLVDPYVKVVVTCRCSGLHADRPAGVVTGCGINFRVDVLAEQS